MYVAVVGAADCDEATSATAEEVGRLLAVRDAIVVTGGAGGVMEAACRGTKAAGGTTIAFLAGLSRREANSYVDIALPTGMGEMRNMLIVRAADVLIAIGGEFGTLSEISFALKVGTPVVGLGTWELVRDGRTSDAIEVVDSPVDAVETALSLAGAV